MNNFFKLLVVLLVFFPQCRGTAETHEVQAPQSQCVAHVRIVAHPEDFLGDLNIIYAEINDSEAFMDKLPTQALSLSLFPLEAMNADAWKNAKESVVKFQYLDILQGKIHSFSLPCDAKNKLYAIAICKDTTPTGRCMDKNVSDLTELSAQLRPRVFHGSFAVFAYGKSDLPNFIPIADKVYYFALLKVTGANLVPVPRKEYRTIFDESPYKYLLRTSSKVALFDSKIGSRLPNVVGASLVIQLPVHKNDYWYSAMTGK